MPKDRRVNLSSSDRDRASPYACITKDSNHGKSENSLPTVRDKKEWKEARCPICVEYPHNAVLLLCSSCAKGCRPYICDTSSRHSNCLDQFLNLSGGALTKEQRDFYFAHTQSNWVAVVLTLLRPTMSTGGQVPQVLCPFCRGRIIGWVVVENVRSYMNSKVRDCSLESCKFSGNYIELRKHARCKHPNVKPSDTDPVRQADRSRLMYERDFRDTLNLIDSQFENEEFNYSPYDSGGDDTPAATVDSNRSTVSNTYVASDFGSDFTFSLLYDIFGPNGSLIGARSPCTKLITSITQAYYERTGDRSLNRRSTGGARSRFRSQASPPRMVRETSSRRFRDRSFDLRSNSQSEVTSSRRVRNTGSRRTGRSSAERSVARRSTSNQVARTTSHERWRNPNPHPHH